MQSQDKAAGGRVIARLAGPDSVADVSAHLFSEQQTAFFHALEDRGKVVAAVAVDAVESAEQLDGDRLTGDGKSAAFDAQRCRHAAQRCGQVAFAQVDVEADPDD